MKKLELKFGNESVLSKNQMKNVKGGKDPAECPCVIDCLSGPGAYLGSLPNDIPTVCGTGFVAGADEVSDCVDGGYDDTTEASWHCTNQ